jgi:hypothetical protein
MNASATLSLRSATMSIFSNDTCFMLKNIGKVEIHNNGVCVKRSTSSKFKVDYYGKLKEIIELQYHTSIIKSFYLNVIGISPLTEQSE